MNFGGINNFNSCTKCKLTNAQPDFCPKASDSEPLGEEVNAHDRVESDFMVQYIKKIASFEKM